MKRRSVVACTATEGGEGQPSCNYKRPKSMLQTRCNPKLYVRLLQRHKDNPGFRRVSREVGLDGLLQLRVSRLHRQLCASLARKVCVSRAALNVHGQVIPLTSATVTKVLGLPCFGNGDMEWPSKDKSRDTTVCSNYNLDPSGRVSLYTLLAFLEQSSIFDEEFKAKFILFTIATLLRPTTNVHMHFREYLPLLSDMSTLTEFNWAKFVLDGLLESIRVFQEKKATSLGGCLLLIQLLYLQCISPVDWNPGDQVFFAKPSLCNWTDERVTIVLKLMREQGGLDSQNVTVRTVGIPSNTDGNGSLMPEVLMHHILIDRINKHIIDWETELSGVLEEFRNIAEQVKLKLGNVESLTISED